MIAGQKVILAMPQTYMNLSGESVRELVDYYKINPAEELVVIYDDINLDTGKLRIRAKGSAGATMASKISLRIWVDRSLQESVLVLVRNRRVGFNRPCAGKIS